MITMASCVGMQAIGRSDRKHVRCSSRKTSADASSSRMQRPLVRLDPELVKSGGIRLVNESEERRLQFEALLNEDFFPLRISYTSISFLEKLSVLNVEPPVLACREFFGHEDCDQLVQLALETQQLQPSRIGGKGGNDDNIRTSTSLPIDSILLESFPKLNTKVKSLLENIETMLSIADKDKDVNFGKFRQPQPGKVTFELPQIARYEKGQHFLMHEDAFPFQVAVKKGYQRRATVLVYLNDVKTGGETRFDALDLSVHPEKGMALIFFPAYSNGIPDRRTIHTACDAVEEKFVFQLWISCGFPREEKRMRSEITASGKKAKSTQKKGFG